MLDSLLGRGFTAKCKSLIKLTRNRIDVIRRKRKATEKFLKKDIADLLANGLDVNAYGRAEGLIGELTLSSCYDFVEQSCDFVLKHLSVLQKVSGCPEECREAISSLMFAAARFSDLPELRDLRQIFQERYGSSLECYVNQQFAANMNSKSSTLEKKVHLMQDIASEFSIKWDSKAFELRMSKPSAFAQGHSAYKFNHSIDDNKTLQGKNGTLKGVKYEALPEKSPGYSDDGHKFQNDKEAAISKRDENHLRSKSKLPENGFKPPSGYDEVNLKRVSHGNPLPGREELTHKKSDKGYLMEGSMPKPIGRSSQDERAKEFEGGSNLRDSLGNATRVRETQDTATARKPPTHAGFLSKNNVNEPLAFSHAGLPDDKSERKVQMDETPRGKPCYSNALPPPYLKPNPRLKNSTQGTNLMSSQVDSDRIPKYPSIHQKPDATSKSERIQSGLDNSEQEPLAIRLARLDREERDKELSNHGDAKEIPALRIPKYPSIHKKPDATSKSERIQSGLDNSEQEPLAIRLARLDREERDKELSNHGDAKEIPALRIPKYPSIHKKPDATSKSERIQSGLDNSEQEPLAIRLARLDREERDKELSNHEDAKEIPALKPKSVRRRHSKSRSTHSDVSNDETEVEKKSRSRRRDETRRGLQILFDDEHHKTDEEERVIDRLLIHYSKKPSASVPEKARRKSRSRHAHQKNGRGDDPDVTPDMVSQTPRSVSLPPEQTGPVEVNKVFARAASFQPDRSSEARHVHPKLPDCDDLAARIAALRGS